MIKMVLVDDEPTIRIGIRTSIDWEVFGLEFVGEAANGVDALTVCMQLKPHIVLTDIRMPFMDGLELSRQLREKLPDTRIVILSGHEEFSYAKEALSLGIQEYLLKPVGAEELSSLLVRLREEIRQDEAVKRSQLSRDHVFNENYPKIKSDFIHLIVRGSTADPSSVYEKAESLQVKLIGRQYSVLAIDIDDFALMTENLPASQRELIRFSVMNVSEELVLSAASGLVGYSEFDHLIGLVCGDTLSSTFIEGLCKEIQHNVKKYLKLSVSVGIGRTRNRMTDLGEAYAEAFSALKTKIYKGRDSLIHYREPKEPAQAQAVLYPSNEEKVITGCIKTLDTAGLNEAIHQIFERFLALQVDAEKIRSICGRLLLVSASSIAEMGIDTAKVIGADFHPYREIERFDTLEDLREWMGEMLFRLTTLVQESKNDKFKGIIKTAIRYMEEHYREDISQADVAAVVYVTPNYLSRVFKEEMGVNFIEWLNRYRIEKAKTFLTEPGAKTSTVAEQVGFSDYKYFSHIFKRFIGCSPKEYKEFR
ncbi:response regulator [Cohnella terricola]|uniref:Response regulator n=1 Tax=Cohnella terricola TaxID=1289167 RepID=A0A559JTU1_9BACL|nr:response regulator [Cohnella terricola]TVY03305.1 response regulator [Cohnella terricola]